MNEGNPSEIHGTDCLAFCHLFPLLYSSNVTFLCLVSLLFDSSSLLTWNIHFCSMKYGEGPHELFTGLQHACQWQQGDRLRFSGGLQWVKGGLAPTNISTSLKGVITEFYEEQVVTQAVTLTQSYCLWCTTYTWIFFICAFTVPSWLLAFYMSDILICEKCCSI